jgi:protein transport protein SEC31
MSLLSEIQDRGAVLEWSPFPERPSLVAVGTKDSAGAGFDEYGGEMELFDLDFTKPSSTPTAPIASVKAA